MEWNIISQSVILRAVALSLARMYRIFLDLISLSLLKVLMIFLA